MAKRRKPLTTDDPLRDLSRAVRRLETGNRANARASVADEIRRLRAFVDKHYPAPKRKVRRRTASTVRAERLADGWVEKSLSGRGWLLNICQWAGVPHSLREVGSVTPISVRKAHTLDAADVKLMVPLWVWAYANENGSLPTKVLREGLVALRKDKTARDALEVRWALRK